MDLSIIGVIIIVVFLAYFIIYGKFVYEQFQNPPFIPLVSEGFTTNDIEIRTCPSNNPAEKSSVFINSVGHNLCCSGLVESNKCIGDVICSLSEGTQSIPTCTEWYRTYLEEKGALRCPKDLPNYFEKLPNAGCTSGSRTKDGTAPLTSTQPYCNIYAKKADNESDIDSCFNKKLLDESVCFDTPGVKSTKRLMYNGKGNPATVQCSYIDSSGNSYTCTTDSTMQRLVAKNLPAGQTIAEWKAGSANWDFLYKLQFCSALEKYKITKKLEPTRTAKSWCFPIFELF